MKNLITILALVVAPNVWAQAGSDTEHFLSFDLDKQRTAILNRYVNVFWPAGIRSSGGVNRRLPFVHERSDSYPYDENFFFRAYTNFDGSVQSATGPGSVTIIVEAWSNSDTVMVHRSHVLELRAGYEGEVCTEMKVSGFEMDGLISSGSARITGYQDDKSILESRLVSYLEVLEKLAVSIKNPK